MKFKSNREKKLVFIPIGGLGNQLFGYAAAKRLSIINNAKLIIDTTSGYKNDRLYQRSYALDNFNIKDEKITTLQDRLKYGNITRKIVTVLEKDIEFSKKRFICQRGLDFKPDLLDYCIQNYSWIRGYWQSEDYFKDYSNYLKFDLKIAQPSDKQNLELFRNIKNSNSVALHVRFFDNLVDDSATNNVRFEYYDKAIGLIKENVKKPHFFIFSDRPELVQGKIQLNHCKYTIVAHNKHSGVEHADLWLMSNCKHFVIANSTFSWWAAWLGEKLSSQFIITPKFETQSKKNGWGFEKLIPSRWIIL